MRTYVVHKDYKDIEDFILTIPSIFEKGEGKVIYKGRNELREFECSGKSFIVKSYKKPNIVNKFIYGIFRPSKAKRSYENALKLLEIGVGTPFPVAYINVRKCLLFDKSYFISLKSECSHVYKELIYNKFDEEELVMREIGRITAIMHNKGYAHRDYGCGNILFEKNGNGVKIDLVDLNRMYIGTVDLKSGCRNFERIPANNKMQEQMAQEYAKLRNFNPDECYRLIKEFRDRQPKINGI